MSSNEDDFYSAQSDNGRDDSIASDPPFSTQQQQQRKMDCEEDFSSLRIDTKTPDKHDGIFEAPTLKEISPRRQLNEMLNEEFQTKMPSPSNQHQPQSTRGRGAQGFSLRRASAQQQRPPSTSSYQSNSTSAQSSPKVMRLSPQQNWPPNRQEMSPQQNRPPSSASQQNRPPSSASQQQNRQSTMNYGRNARDIQSRSPPNFEQQNRQEMSPQQNRPPSTSSYQSNSGRGAPISSSGRGAPMSPQHQRPPSSNYSNDGFYESNLSGRGAPISSLGRGAPISSSGRGAPISNSFGSGRGATISSSGRGAPISSNSFGSGSGRGGISSGRGAPISSSGRGAPISPSFNSGRGGFGSGRCTPISSSGRGGPLMNVPSVVRNSNNNGQRSPYNYDQESDYPRNSSRQSQRYDDFNDNQPQGNFNGNNNHNNFDQRQQNGYYSDANSRVANKSPYYPQSPQPQRQQRQQNGYHSDVNSRQNVPPQRQIPQKLPSGASHQDFSSVNEKFGQNEGNITFGDSDGWINDEEDEKENDEDEELAQLHEQAEEAEKEDEEESEEGYESDDEDERLSHLPTLLRKIFHPCRSYSERMALIAEDILSLTKPESSNGGYNSFPMLEHHFYDAFKVHGDAVAQYMGYKSFQLMCLNAPEIVCIHTWDLDESNGDATIMNYRPRRVDKKAEKLIEEKRAGETEKRLKNNEIEKDVARVMNKEVLPTFKELDFKYRLCQTLQKLGGLNRAVDMGIFKEAHEKFHKEPLKPKYYREMYSLKTNHNFNDIQKERLFFEIRITPNKEGKGLIYKLRHPLSVIEQYHRRLKDEIEKRQEEEQALCEKVQLKHMSAPEYNKPIHHRKTPPPQRYRATDFQPLQEEEGNFGDGFTFD